MRAITLNATKAGMTRLREKGGASPETLYELTNGYVSASKAPRQRPGTTWKYTWPARTKGMCAYKDAFYAFSTQIITTGNPLYVVATLRHPDATFTGDIRQIHYAQPFLGYLYVVAEFDNDTIFHYWLRNPDAWTAETIHVEGDLVQPTTPNGYYYKAVRTEDPPAWAANVERAVSDVVQPTVYTGWKYTVVAVDGDHPASGITEPTWPETEGAQVDEFVGQKAPDQQPAPPASNPSNPADPRYGNPGGPGSNGGNNPYFNNLAP